MNINKLLKKFFGKLLGKATKSEQETYVEKDTYCDLCKYADECDSRLEITRLSDTRSHYICMMGGFCKARDFTE